MGEVRTHRPEEHARKAATSASADDEEASLLVEQAVPRVAVDDVTRQRDVIVTRKRVGPCEFVVSEATSCRVVTPIDEAGIDHRWRRFPGMDEHDRVAGSGMREGPTDGGARGGRAIDADDDPLRSTVGHGAHGLRSRWSRLRLAEFAMTDKLDMAMAAAAIIGFRNPAAAIGIAAVL